MVSANIYPIYEYWIDVDNKNIFKQLKKKMENLINFLNAKKKSLIKFFTINEPDINIDDQKELMKILKSGYVSSIGKDINNFEKKIINITKAKFVVSTINGTSALHIALKVVGVEPNDEVLVPSLSFIAPVNAILYNNADPHFIDSEMDHFGVDPIKLENLKENTL